MDMFTSIEKDFQRREEPYPQIAQITQIIVGNSCSEENKESEVLKLIR
jgi:hypothetical protein